MSGPFPARKLLWRDRLIEWCAARLTEMGLGVGFEMGVLYREGQGRIP